MQAQQQAQDPVMQMQMQELQIKMQELQLKEKKLTLDAAAAADKQALEEQKVTGQLELDSMRVGAQIKESQFKQQFEQERAGLEMGIDIAKNKAQADLQARTTALQNQFKTEPKS
jgi:hypothetical protein